MSFGPPSEYDRATDTACLCMHRSVHINERLPPMRFVAPTAFSRHVAAALTKGRSFPVLQPSLHLQVFSTSWRFDPPRACRSYFIPDPLLGFTLQGFTPHTQPHTVPGVRTLMWLETTRHGCRRTRCRTAEAGAKHKRHWQPHRARSPTTGFCSA